MQTAVLLLAAGASSRMGQSKQLLRIGGLTLLEHSVTAARGVTSNIIVVLGSEYELHRTALLSLPVTIVENAAWQEGMGKSLKLGLNHLISRVPTTDAVIVMVCDQPNVTTAHLLKLVDKARNTKRTIVASAYAGTVGVPALFKEAQFQSLLSVDDEAGARKVIRQYPHLVEAVDFPGGNIDLDSPTDYAAYLAQNDPGRKGK